MWKLFFEVCDFLCNFIPNSARRENIRRNRLYDWRRKYNALRAAYPDLDFRHTKIIKGGWNIGFIVDNKYVFKIRKKYDDTRIEKISREKRITDAFADIVSLRVPHIDIIKAGEFTFYKYDFITGHNMNSLPGVVIANHAAAWGAQIGEFIYAMHNARPVGIDDLRDRDGDGWNHNDICNNVLVDMHTMKIVGIIDWEYAGWGMLDTEFMNCVRFSKKIRKSNILNSIKSKYYELDKKNSDTVDK